MAESIKRRTKRALLGQVFAYPLHTFTRNIETVDLGIGEGLFQVSGKESYAAAIIQDFGSFARSNSPSNISCLVSCEIVRGLAGDPNVLSHQLFVIRSYRVKGTQLISHQFTCGQSNH